VCRWRVFANPVTHTRTHARTHTHTHTHTHTTHYTLHTHTLTTFNIRYTKVRYMAMANARKRSNIAGFTLQTIIHLINKGHTYRLN